jgi:hypothetical protein
MKRLGSVYLRVQSLNFSELALTQVLRLSFFFIFKEINGFSSSCHCPQDVENSKMKSFLHLIRGHEDAWPV